MIDIILLRQKDGTLRAQYEEGSEKVKDEFVVNQPIRGKLTKPTQGYQIKNEQLNLLHACFKLVSDNCSDTPQLRTPELVKYSCKAGIDFRLPDVLIVRPDGGVQFLYDSYSRDTLKGDKRQRVIQESFEWLAETIGFKDTKTETAVEQLVREAQSRMKKRGWHEK